MIYQYPTGRKAKPKLPASSRYLYKSNPAKEEQIGPIQGRIPDSIHEYRVAVALWRFKLRFTFQVPINGGKSRRSGQVVDFVVYNPLPTAVQVYGTYWHSGGLATEDSLKEKILKRLFNQRVIILSEDQLETQEEAFNAVREALIL